MTGVSGYGVHTRPRVTVRMGNSTDETHPHVVAWKVAREACASLKQSQLMRLFVPEKPAYGGTGQVAVNFGPWRGLDCGWRDP